MCEECAGSGRTRSASEAMLRDAVRREDELVKQLAWPRYDVQTYTEEVAQHTE